MVLGDIKIRLDDLGHGLHLLSDLVSYEGVESGEGGESFRGSGLSDGVVAVLGDL